MEEYNLVVLGSFVVDLMSRTPHLPRRGETVFGGPFKMGPGGKGSNQCIAARRAGANTVIITKLGRDLFADIALNAYRTEGISTDYVFQDDELKTGSALIMVEDESAENEIVVSPGACKNILPEEIEKTRKIIGKAKVFLTQLETNMEAVLNGLKLGKEYGLTTILNPAPVQDIPEELYQYIDIITPNETEAENLTGIEVSDLEGVKKAAEFFLSKGVEVVIITLGEKGVYLKTQDISKNIKGFSVKKVVDTTGAGDAFNGGFATALTEGKDLEEAIIFGNAVGALSVTKEGTAPAMPRRDEIEEFLEKNQIGGKEND